MSTDLAIPQTFEQKMMERIRESIGELMTEDDLKRIVERGVEQALFTRKEYGQAYDRRIEPSLVEKAVEKFLAQKMEAAVNRWIADNQDHLKSAVDAAVKAGVGGCLLSALDHKFSFVFQDVVNQLQNHGLLNRG